MKNLLALALLATPILGLAQASNYGVLYSGSFSQVSDAPPAGSNGWNCQVAVSGLTVGTFIGGTVSFPGGRSETLTSIDGSALYYPGTYWSTPAELLLDFPTGTYQFDVTPTVGAPETAFLNIAAVDFPDDVPYLTLGSWSSLQGCAPGSDLGLTWLGFNVSGAPSTKITSIQIQNYVNPASTFSETGDPSVFQSVTVPGTFLESGRFYGLNLAFGSFREPNTGLGGATGYVGTQHGTGTTFKVLASPGTVSGNLTLSGHTNPSTKTYSVQLLDGGGNVLEAQTHPVGYSGWYAFDTALTSVVSVRFDSVGFLSKVVNAVDLSVGQDFVNVTLLNGDVNDDGEVGPGDFSLFAAGFGSFAGDPNYSAAADLDGDGEIGPVDFGLLAFSFGQFDE